MRRFLSTFFLAFVFSYFPLFGISREVITSDVLHSLFQGYYKDDPKLREYIDHFPFENYDIYVVENRDIFYVDNIPDLIKSQFVRSGILWEVHVFEQLWHYTKPGTTAIDIGGHIGTHTLSLSRLVGNGTVHVFEPQLKIFAELVINMYLNGVHNIIFHREALGNVEKMVEMNASVLSNEGGVGIGSGGDIVKMKTLDSFNLTNVSIMKVDVEGLEIEVLEGGNNMILSNKPVMIVEIMGGVFYNTATPKQKEIIHERMRKIEALGYKVHPIGLHDYLCLPKELKGMQVRG